MLLSSVVFDPAKVEAVLKAARDWLALLPP
jgi:hypothetical protein